MQGLGTDIIEIVRIERFLSKPAFLTKVFTKNEIEYIQSKGNNAAQSAAGFFSAKEAIVKALGTGFGTDISASNIEISHDSFGKPYAKILNSVKDYNIILSISHCREYAVATAILL